ncbi:cysteine-rich venom protein pseudechetoxin-like [Pelobates fuscus]|uniref:cysteine-rich venom protein pseudechetoxin-like n=1 Tax=Pelobates fuscus TaxID=191477 RepID=UPI002FE479E2
MDAKPQAIIPSWRLTNAKSWRSLRAASSGRQVNIPEENIKKMLNVPFSSLLTSNEDVKKAIIFSHNEARRNAKPSASNMLEMVWDDDAAKKAEGYAKMCIAGHSPPSYRKISDINCGENVFLSSFKAAWEDVLQSFLSEAVDFDYGKGPKSPSLEIRHYTQMMWASSNRVGCGVAECSNNVFKYDYVCIYCPGGNDGDSIGFPYKSGPACEDCKSSCDKGLCTNPCPHQDKYADCKDYYHGQKCDASLEEDCPATSICHVSITFSTVLTPKGTQQFAEEDSFWTLEELVVRRQEFPVNRRSDET